MEKEDRKDHDDTRRRIEQDSRDGQGRQFDGCEVADIEKDDAPQAGPQEHPDIPRRNGQTAGLAE